MPGKPVYSIGRPAFDKAVINLPSEKTFSIVVKNNSKSNKYIESVLLNGKALDTPFFGHQDIVAGGIMEIKMTDHPTQWEVTTLLNNHIKTITNHEKTLIDSLCT